MEFKNRHRFAAAEVPKHEDLDELARLSKELADRSKNRPDNYTPIGSQIVKTELEPLPAHLKLESRISSDTVETAQQLDRSGYVTDASSATWQFNNSFSPHSIVSMNGAKIEETGLLKVRTSAQSMDLEEDKYKRGIIKRKDLDSREQMIEPARRDYQVTEIVQHKPKVTQNIERKEEVRRTEEVERRVIRRERRQKSSRQRYGYGYGGHEAVDWYSGSGGERRIMTDGLAKSPSSYKNSPVAIEELNEAVRTAYEVADKTYFKSQHRSNSSHRGHNGYLPAYETYYRSSSNKRNGDHDDRGIAHARYGSLSDSLRRGELKYVPNGEVREKGSRMHKSYSTRDVFHDGGGGDSFSSFRRSSEARGAPFIEYPPTLPRSERSGPPIPPHRGADSFYKPIVKSRSYADWDEGRGGFGNSARRYDDDMARLENEFRDSLLMPMNGNMNEKDYRHENIPGGYETYNRESKANVGRRLNRDGLPTDFKEGSQEYSFKREVQR